MSAKLLFPSLLKPRLLLDKQKNPLSLLGSLLLHLGKINLFSYSVFTFHLFKSFVLYFCHLETTKEILHTYLTTLQSVIQYLYLTFHHTYLLTNSKFTMSHFSNPPLFFSSSAFFSLPFDSSFSSIPFFFPWRFHFLDYSTII